MTGGRWWGTGQWLAMTGLPLPVVRSRMSRDVVSDRLHVLSTTTRTVRPYRLGTRGYLGQGGGRRRIRSMLTN